MKKYMVFLGLAVIIYCHAKAEAHPKIVKGAKVAGGGLAFLLSIGSSLGNILRYKG